MPRRFRTFLLWAAFALAAIAGGLAVYRLYASVQREIAVQSERAVQQERTRFLERVKTYTDEVRRSIITDLASFHADGLGPALRQWDVANEIITGTFVCDPVQGFAPDFTAPAGAPSRDKLAEFWQQFRAWRAQHPAAIAQADSVHAGPWQTLDYRLLDNAAFPAGDLGYQGENLELITQAGRRADPWAGWAGCTDDPRAPWVFWYQPGPDETVRGCFVEIGPILRQLRSEISSSGSVRLEMVPVTASDPILDSATLLPWLPGCRLTATPGEVFLRKASDARLTALVAALLFGAFLTGVAALTVFTRRESHEAERKINFVAQVSHELRTPLTSIRMYADLLTAAGLTDEKRFRFAGTISAESQRLGALIERLLAFNALEKGNGKIVCASIDVGALVRATIEETDSSLRSAGLRVELNLPAESIVALERAFRAEASVAQPARQCRQVRRGRKLGAHFAHLRRGQGAPAGRRRRTGRASRDPSPAFRTVRAGRPKPHEQIARRRPGPEHRARHVAPGRRRSRPARCRQRSRLRNYSAQKSARSGRKIMNTHQRKVLVVEDDAAIRGALQETLTANGHAVVGASDGAEALRLFGDGGFDLVLLDLMLPSVSGYDVCRKIREKNRAVPIIMLTARGEEIDKVLGLELGADDYVTKPFGVREILARVHAAFRRLDVATAPAANGPADTFYFGPTLIDRKRFTATHAGVSLELTARELHLLEVFHRCKGEVLSRDQLLNEVWGINYQGTTRTLDQHVAQVRKKIGDNGPAPLIKTVHGVGYQHVG